MSADPVEVLDDAARLVGLEAAIDPLCTSIERIGAIRSPSGTAPSSPSCSITSARSAPPPRSTPACGETA